MDIIVFAAISVFILFKLRSQLGKISDEEKNILEARKKAKEEQIINIQKQITESVNKVIEKTIEQENKIKEKFLGHLDEATKQTMLDILNRCKIDTEFFINGVKSCFEMVLKAFASKDFNTLKTLLSERIFIAFESAIKNRENEKKNLHSNIISIDKTEILSAQIIENKAFVTIKFVSKQINYFTNFADQIIEGTKNEMVEMTDIWTFTKDLTSADPSWIITKTGY